MKNKKELMLSIVLIAVGCISILGSFGNTEDKLMFLYFGFSSIVGGSVLLIISKKQSTKSVADTPSASASPPQTKTSIPEGQMNYNLFFDVEENTALCYEYENNICLDAEAFSLVRGNGGKGLTFVQEPDNEYDKNAVAIYLGPSKLGYVYRGTIQDMINDYIARGWSFKGYINKYSIEEKKATFKVGFYKPLDQFISKEFNLTKVKKKIDENTKRIDNLEFCSEADSLSIKYDNYDGAYIVYTDTGDEIGELPANAEDFLSEGSYKKLIGILLEFKRNDDYNITGAKIRVYLVD